MTTSRSIEAVIRVSLVGGQRLPKVGPLFPRDVIVAAWNAGDPIRGTRVHRVSGLTISVPEALTEEGAVLNALTVLESFNESLNILREEHGAEIAVDVPCFLEPAHVSLTVALTPEVLTRLGSARCALLVSCYATASDELDAVP